MGFHVRVAQEQVDLFWSGLLDTCAVLTADCGTDGRMISALCQSAQRHEPLVKGAGKLKTGGTKLETNWHQTTRNTGDIMKRLLQKKTVSK